MERYSVDEAIEMAIQTERLGYQFYTAMAEKFNNNTQLKDLFHTLALKEKSHEAIFMKLRDKARSTKIENPEEVGHYMRAMVESEFFIGKEKSLPSLEKVETVNDVVDFAMGFEKETLLYFIGMRSMFTDSGPVDEVISEERSHIAWLSKFKGSI